MGEGGSNPWMGGQCNAGPQVSIRGFGIHLGRRCSGSGFSAQSLELSSVRVHSWF